MSLGERDEGLAAEMTTAAGGIRQTKIIALGAGVTALQAIATADGVSALSFTVSMSAKRAANRSKPCDTPQR
jgi:NAD/NADP transhydrogenase alpha subunit